MAQVLSLILLGSICLSFLASTVIGDGGFILDKFGLKPAINVFAELRMHGYSSIFNVKTPELLLRTAVNIPRGAVNNLRMSLKGGFGGFGQESKVAEFLQKNSQIPADQKPSRITAAGKKRGFPYGFIKKSKVPSSSLTEVPASPLNLMSKLHLLPAFMASTIRAEINKRGPVACGALLLAHLAMIPFAKPMKGYVNGLVQTINSYLL